MKPRSYLQLVLVLFLLFLARHSVSAQTGETYAIKGGTIVTVTGAIIPNGVVVIRNGLIAAVGADVAVPADCAGLPTGDTRSS